MGNPNKGGIMDQMTKAGQCFCRMLALCAMAAMPVSQALSQTPTRGEFLVATPALDGTAFAQTVILLIHHDDDGSIGIMVNRPTNVSATTVLPDPRLSDYQGSAYFGGPVAPTRALLLYRGIRSLSDSAVRVLSDVYLHADSTDLTAAPPEAIDPTRIRVYAGRAEWRAGQLSQELAADLWDVVAGNSDHVFSGQPFELWRRLRALNGQETAKLYRLQPQSVASAGLGHR
jgi:putative transcriptional regulator